MNEYFLYLDINSIIAYEKSNNILNIIFVFIDLVLISLSIIKFRPTEDKLVKLRTILFSILLIDILFRTFHIFIFNIFNIKFYHDIINYSIATFQFYLILSLFISVLSVLKIKYEIDISNLSFLFLLLTFPFNRFIPTNPISTDFFIGILKKILILAQSAFTIIFIYILYRVFKKKISKIVNLIIKEDESSDPSDELIHKFIIGSPLSCSLLFILYFLIKIYFLFVREPYTIFYGTIALDIIYNGALYFVFLICLTVVYALNKISTMKEKQLKKLEEEVKIINNN
jgi:hypothetical protein